MSKRERFFEVTDKIIEALDQEVVPFTDLAAIACGGKTEQNCSQCGKKIVVQSIFLEDFPWKDAHAKIVFKPLETERYVCGGSECQNKDWHRYNDKASSWLMAVMATIQKLQETCGI